MIGREKNRIKTEPRNREKNQSQRVESNKFKNNDGKKKRFIEENKETRHFQKRREKTYRFINFLVLIKHIKDVWHKKNINMNSKKVQELM